MYVLGIGNVTACNKSYIFLNNEGKQQRIRTTKELLTTIINIAISDIAFYSRMRDVLMAEYEKRKAEVDKKYYFITDNMIKEAFTISHKKGVELSWSKDSNNEECIRQYSKVFGLYGGVDFANKLCTEAHKLLAQGRSSLNQI